ncbi:MAG: TRAP transporter substrate-binding protein DctP [Verrucomicrobia bacterium]|nr:TRAP transporter substrate-binding protein DctP [Verrucomicrobiota bacterium]
MILRSLIFSCLLSTLAFAQGAKPAPRVLKLGHMFPASTGDTGDFRDRLARAFATEVEKRTAGSIKFEVHPNNTLTRADQQFDALSKGQMAASILPLNMLFPRIPDLRVTQLPCIIKNYEHALRWKTAPIGKELKSMLEAEGLVVLTWLWQPAGLLSIQRPVLGPNDVKDIRVRSMGPSIDSLMNMAGAATPPMPAADVPKAFRERRLEVVLTSSTSLAEFKLQDVCKGVTTPRQRALFYFPIPIVFAKSVFDTLTPEQRKALEEIGEALEPQALAWARADDQKLAESFLANNAQVAEMDEEQFLNWQRIAKLSAWRDFEKSSPRAPELLQKAQAVQ